MGTSNSVEIEREAKLALLLNGLIASLSNPLHSLIMRMEVGDGHGSTDLYLIDADGHPLHYSRRSPDKIWDHFYEWRKPTHNAPDKWNLAILRWSPGHGIAVEYGQTDVEDMGGFPARRTAWQKQEFGAGEIPFFIEERKRKSEGSVAEKT